MLLVCKKKKIDFGEMPSDSSSSWRFNFPYSEREKVILAIGHSPTEDSLDKFVYVASFYTHLFPGRFGPSDYDNLAVNHLRINDGLVWRIVTEIVFEGAPKLEPSPRLGFLSGLKVLSSKYL